MNVDLNADLGEGAASDNDILAHITSANIACGFHAGDATLMRRTVAAALEHGVAVGAHPGLPDRAGFGRNPIPITPEEVHDIILYQVGALMAVAGAQGARVAHVKPHGALYNMAAADPQLADAVARAVRDVDGSLTLFGLAGSALIAAGEAHGLRTLAEGFPDRGYAADGSLLPRTHSRAMVHDPAEVAMHAVALVRAGGIETLCIHGDAPRAAEVARAVRAALEADGISVSQGGGR